MRRKQYNTQPMLQRLNVKNRTGAADTTLKAVTHPANSGGLL